MNEKMDVFCKELRTKLDGVEKRIKDLNTGAKGATEKAKADAKARLAALADQAKAQRVKTQTAEAKAKEWLEEKKAVTAEKIANWKAQHEVKKLAAHADIAEDYAAASIDLAAGAIDEAERAAVEAISARLDANAAA